MQNLFSPHLVLSQRVLEVGRKGIFFSLIDDLFFSFGHLDCFFFIYLFFLIIISNQLTNHVLLHQLLPDLGTLHRIS